MKFLLTKLVNDKFRYYLHINSEPAQHHKAKLIWYGITDNATRFHSEENGAEVAKVYGVDGNLEIIKIKNER